MNTEYSLDIRNFNMILRSIIMNLKLWIARMFIKHPKVTLYCSATGFIIGLLCIVLLKTTPEVNAQSEHVNTKYFTTISVEAGDTLWDIAEEYRTVEYASVQDYIDEVKEINHITGDDITTGCYLTVPYYAEKPIEQ